MNEVARFTPRNWQKKCFDKFQEIRQIQKDFLICACPGAGKTKVALHIAQELLSTKKIEQIIVVTPSESLKRQWSEEASAFFGIELDPTWANSDFNVNRDYNGICVTFNAVARQPSIHRRLCQHRILVILDEIHHAGDESSWGASLRQAFEMATFRLGLSGTPFRSDDQAIPFVAYDDCGHCKPDYSYTYARGLQDKIVADVVFPKHDGKMVWIDEDGVQDCSFKDELAPKDAARRLRTALDSNGEWLRTVLKAADDDLTRVRNNPDSPHHEAGGLILAIDKVHAREIRGIMVEELGWEEPVLATSDEPEARQRIEEFSHTKTRWLVAVRMVSEGVDIPRLRVLLYTTNWCTELFFIQAIGRIIRVDKDRSDNTGSVYIPSDPRLEKFAKRIKEDVDHFIKSRMEETQRELGQGGHEHKFRAWDPLDSSAHLDGSIYDQDEYTQTELDQAVGLATRHGISADPTHLAALIRELAGRPSVENDDRRTVQTSDQRQKPMHKMKEKLRKQVHQAAKRLALEHGVHWRTFHRIWRIKGGQSQKDASLEDLKGKHAWLIQLMNAQELALREIETHCPDALQKDEDDEVPF